MPSAIGHIFGAVAISKLAEQKSQTWKFWLLTAACAVLPDADVITFKLGIPYASFFGHRGFFHSVFFAAIVGAIVCSVFYREKKMFSVKWLATSFYFFCITASHGILDAFTSGGEGVAFFSPFNMHRYFFPVHPIKVSPVNVEAFFSEWGLKVLLSESLYIYLPSLLIILLMNKSKGKIN